MKGKEIASDSFSEEIFDWQERDDEDEGDI
jgi:hypothetical protein